MVKMDLWQNAISLNKEYKKLKLDDTIDYEKYKLYSIVTSSTALEGSTLTEIDTQLLLDEGITASGKPLEHHLMVKDNYNALLEALKAADEKRTLSPEFLRELNGYNMASTGAVVNNILGTVDGKKGEFRLVNAFSEALGYYLDPKKIPSMVDKFCEEYNKQLESEDPVSLLKTAFTAHANLIIIHPWQDGNKRTSRLLMNFIERRSGIPLTKVHKEDAAKYLTTLKIYKDNGDIDPFRKFMCEQHIKTIKAEISAYKNRNKGMMLMF